MVYGTGTMVIPAPIWFFDQRDQVVKLHQILSSKLVPYHTIPFHSIPTSIYPSKVNGPGLSSGLLVSFLVAVGHVSVVWCDYSYYNGCLCHKGWNKADSLSIEDSHSCASFLLFPLVPSTTTYTASITAIIE